MGTLSVQRPEMKHLVVFTALVVSCFGRGEVDGIFKDNTYYPKSVREENVWAPRLGRDCSPPVVEDCRGDLHMHPYPCDCHKYFQCTGDGLFTYDCNPHYLIFNPLTEVCEYPESAPPGLCQDTPDGSTTTTTLKPTTTNAPTTTTIPDCWICPGCTCDSTLEIAIGTTSVSTSPTTRTASGSPRGPTTAVTGPSTRNSPPVHGRNWFPAVNRRPDCTLRHRKPVLTVKKNHL